MNSLLITPETLAAIELDQLRSGTNRQEVVLSEELLQRSALQTIFSMEQTRDIKISFPKGAYSWLRSYNAMLLSEMDVKHHHDTIVYFCFETEGMEGLEKLAISLTNVFEKKYAKQTFTSELVFQIVVDRFLHSHILEELAYS